MDVSSRSMPGNRHSMPVESLQMNSTAMDVTVGAKSLTLGHTRANRTHSDSALSVDLNVTKRKSGDLSVKFARKSSNNVTILSAKSHSMEKRWNVFRSIPGDHDIFDPQWTIIGAQILKVIFYILLHLSVLFCALTAKMFMLLMVANIRPGYTYVSCKAYGIHQTYMAVGISSRPSSAVAWFYWGLWIALCVPEILTWIRCIRMVFFKWVPTPTFGIFSFALVVETLRIIGYCLLVFVVLPDLDTVRAAMLLCAVGFVPSLLNVLTRMGGCAATAQTCVTTFSDIAASMMQFTALWLWPIYDRDLRVPGFYPLALVLTSLEWWENYVSKSATISIISYLGQVKEALQRTRYKNHLILCLWKVFLSFFCMVLAGGEVHPVQALFELSDPLYINRTSSTTISHSMPHRTALILALCLLIATVICFELAKYACKVRMHLFSYSIPIASAIPLSIVLSLVLCEMNKSTPCYLAHILPDSVFWNCNYGNVMKGLIVKKHGWVVILWMSSYLWLVFHIFTQKPGRLSKSDTLFVRPFYNGLFIDNSLALNRRRITNKRRVRTKALRDEEYAGEDSVATEGTDMSLLASLTSLSLSNSNADSLTKIYICATMWHETLTEMKQMLKSIIRMDEDQSARKNAQKYLKVVDPDYYELEAHIFFDDAWTDDERTGERVPNAFVLQMVGVINEAASDIHKVPIELRAPVKFDVPYGGRLVYTLPGDSRLYIHLKDKIKCRHKKRWSQVMYMYYLLGHRIMELISDTGRKQLLADNTYILAIDGDSKFSPAAVQKLVDLLKTDARLGAACGRIHPIGAGMMVWYQKFEYAIAHWFQKAAEHVFGCVLCSPGCFSLFRGSALMDDNVMHKYTKLPFEPYHFVQYDQGEDRWLSTLLLKQGYRIEYAAASDAETYAPEGFGEFYNQRRRWTPSSIANTLDLLSDFKKAVNNNDSISRLYIAYQMLVILFSLLSPAIIFTMLVFSQVAAFHVSSHKMLWINLVPVVLFCTLCFITGSKAQLTFAKFMSVVYAFVMMAVLVGTGIQIAAEGMGSPTSVFVLSLSGIFCSAAFFHPREFSNIFYGAVFFLMIPSTYMLMALYSLINLNVINWGTREAAQKAAGKNVSETKVQQWLRKARAFTKPGEEDKVDVCQQLCRCFFCCQDARSDDRLLWVGNRLERLDKRMEHMEVRADGRGVARLNLHKAPQEHVLTEKDEGPVPEIMVTHSSPPDNKSDYDTPSEMSQVDLVRYRIPEVQPVTPAHLSSMDAILQDVGESDEDRQAQKALDELQDDYCKPILPAWMQLPELREGANDVLDELEHQFWNDFIIQYLTPLKKSSDEEAEIAVGLARLRNMIAFGLLLINGLIVLVIYLLQINKDLLSFEFSPHTNYTWNKWSPSAGEYEKVQEPLKIEPIGFTVILFLSLLLITQTAGMFLHRFHTVSHILSSTILTCFKRRKPGHYFDENELLDVNGVEIARNLQKLEDETDKGEAPSREDARKGRRKNKGRRVIFNIERSARKRAREGKKGRRLNAMFQKRFFTFNADKHRNSLRGVRLAGDSPFFKSEPLRVATAMALSNRRDSLLVRSTDKMQAEFIEARALASLAQRPSSSLRVTPGHKKLSFDDEPQIHRAASSPDVSVRENQLLDEVNVALDMEATESKL